MGLNHQPWGVNTTAYCSKHCATIAPIAFTAYCRMSQGQFDNLLSITKITTNYRELISQLAQHLFTVGLHHK